MKKIKYLFSILFQNIKTCIFFIFSMLYFLFTGRAHKNSSGSFLRKLGSFLFQRGYNKKALSVYTILANKHPIDNTVRLQCAIVCFIMSDYVESRRWLTLYENRIAYEKKNLGIDLFSQIEILDHSWTIAIGHIAFIQTYIKAKKLGFFAHQETLLPYSYSNPPTGSSLFKYFKDDITFLEHSEVNKYLFRQIYKTTSEPVKDKIRRLLAKSFWSGKMADGNIEWFAPFAASVEKKWKDQGNSFGYCQLSDEEKAEFRLLMKSLYGLPEEAWFVVLHVREPGYHKAWGKYHHSARDADIRDYSEVIKFITSKGGWVIRAGDASMRPLPKYDNVIDYAISDYKSEEIDILICASCSFFIGTNSGFSLIPSIFGKRSLLTNWAPLAVPNWFTDDKFIPKLVYNPRARRYLTFTEMYASIAGWSQFKRDFKANGWVLENNKPDDLLAATIEIYSEIFENNLERSLEDNARLSKFNNIIIDGGGYLGSQICTRFLEKYDHLL